MKTGYGTILVLAMAAVVLFSASLPCRAAEKGEESIWREEKPGRLHRRFELTEERIERMMNRLGETDPEKAEQLARLREKEPEKFKAELRKIMRERFGKRFREQKGQRTGRRGRHHAQDKPVRHGMRGGPARGQGRGMMMRERHREFLEWLKKNYPEEADRLAGLKEKRPKLHTRRMALSLGKYRRIFEAAKENPELAEVLKEDLELKEKRGELLKKIKAAKDDEKKKLVEELEETVSSRFDLILRKKLIEYENLLKKLEKLKERVKQSEAEVKKWKAAKFKKENVKARVEELVSETERFKW